MQAQPIRPSEDNPWQTIRRAGVWGIPLPHLDRTLDRLLLRLVADLARRQVRRIHSPERLLTADPFILAANHSSRREVLYLSAILMLARGGRPVHFLADWNFRLIPGAAYLYERTGAITVARKPARPAFLNRFKDDYLSDTPPHAQARARLEAGASIGLFPEGTVNRRADALLRSRTGAARLAVATRTPVLPLGIRFLGRRAGGAQLDSSSPIELSFGEPLMPPLHGLDPDRAELESFKLRIMESIGALCGKTPWKGRPCERAVGADRRETTATTRFDQTDQRGEAPC